MGDRLWITWEQQRRNRSLSKELNATLCEYSLELPRLIKHPYLVILTFFKIIMVRPRILFVQNPSMVLAFFSVFLGRLIKIPVVVDAHNSGVFPFSGKYGWAVKVCNIINRNASCVIVSNEALKQHVEKHGGQCVVLPDPIPEISAMNDQDALSDKFEVLFVCTWSADEPYWEVIHAAENLDDSIHLYITGKFSRIDENLSEKVSKNVTLTGFLPDDEYEKLLTNVNVVMDLTTFDDCLVCGAYESIAAEKPIILSNNTASRSYFNEGVVHVENTKEEIVRGIYKSRDEIELLKHDIIELKKRISKEWRAQLLDADALFENFEKRS